MIDYNVTQIKFIKKAKKEGKTYAEIAKAFKKQFKVEKTPNAIRKAFKHYEDSSLVKPKVLIYDIETAPMKALIWQLWENNVNLGQIEKDWHLLSWSAKWLDSPESEVMYMDQSKARNVEDDSKILKGIWKLLDEADIVITQNGKKFDNKKLNARFIIQGMRPPSSYRNIDTLAIARKIFGFTSNKLAYMTEKLCKKYKKLKHSNFPGLEMWIECLAGNKKAWKEMEKYNKHDVLSLEELYHILTPWDNSINFSAYSDSEEDVCNCGSTTFVKNGFYYTNAGKYQRYRCTDCGAESKGNENLLSKEKRKKLKKPTSRVR